MSLVVDLPAKELTLDDVAELAAADPDHRYELQEGTLLVMPPPDREHASILAAFIMWLGGQGYGRGQVLATPGVRVPRDDKPDATGRSPDIVVTRQPASDSTVWLDPAEVLLVVEIVSPGSEDVDRVTKHAEYARAGIPNYWRVERGGPATVYAFHLGTAADGRPSYIPYRTVLLDDLLAGDDTADLLSA